MDFFRFGRKSPDYVQGNKHTKSQIMDFFIISGLNCDFFRNICIRSPQYVFFEDFFFVFVKHLTPKNGNRGIFCRGLSRYGIFWGGAWAPEAP